MANGTWYDEHIDLCAVGQIGNGPDHTDGSKHSWSGWPGAYCLGCGIEDAQEICMGGCMCGCHNEFWLKYAKEMRKEPMP